MSNSRTPGNCFSSRKSEEYLECVFRAPHDRELPADELRLEVSGFGTRAIHVQRREDGSWAASFRLPPALDPGWHPVRLRFADTGFGNELRIAVDVPAGRPDQLTVKDVYDGKSWNRGEVEIADGGFVSFWVSGLPENRSALDVRVLLGEIPLQITWIGPTEKSGYCQINAKVPPDVTDGAHRSSDRVRGRQFGAARASRSEFEQVALLSHVLRPRRPHLDHRAFRLVDMAAEEVFGLMLLDELAHGAAAGVKAGSNAVEIGIERRRVADQHGRLQRRQTFPDEQPSPPLSIRPASRRASASSTPARRHASRRYRAFLHES